jgi:hypothetical protein
MTLYEINEQIQKAIELGFDPETGEILDASALEQLQLDRDEKIENICLFIKDLKAEAAALDAEKKNLDARSTVAKRKSDSLSRYLQAMLDGEKFKTARCSISYRKTSAVIVDDENELPELCVRIRKEPNKTAIKDYINAGVSVPGAHIEYRQSMIIK